MSLYGDLEVTLDNHPSGIRVETDRHGTWIEMLFKADGADIAVIIMEEDWEYTYEKVQSLLAEERMKR